MAKNDPHFRLRVPAELKARIEATAASNNRSINAEIVARLEQTYSAESEQSRMLGEQMAATVELTSRVQGLLHHLSVFAQTFDDAARGDMRGVEHFIELARKQPLEPAPPPEKKGKS